MRVRGLPGTGNLLRNGAQWQLAPWRKRAAPVFLLQIPDILQLAHLQR